MIDQRILYLAERLEYRLAHPHPHPYTQARALGCTRNALRHRLLRYTGQHAPKVQDAELVQYAREVVSTEKGPVQRSARKPFCALLSCLHHHPLKRLCTIGLHRTSGECPEYQATKKEPVPLCRRLGCIYYYKDDWRGRCRLGHRMPKAGRCKYYVPKPDTGRKMKRVPACSKSSCVHWRREDGRHRCRLGLSRRSGQDCPEYQSKETKRPRI